MKKQKVLKSFVARANALAWVARRPARGGRREHRVYQARIPRVECSIKPRRDLIKCDFNRVLLIEKAQVRELSDEQIAATTRSTIFKYRNKS